MERQTSLIIVQPTGHLYSASCFWSATVFKSAEQRDGYLSHLSYMFRCNIPLIAIANNIFRKKEVDKMSGMFRTLLSSKGFHSTGQLFIALGQNIRNLNFYSLLVS